MSKEDLLAYSVPVLFLWPWIWIAVGVKLLPEEYAIAAVAIALAPYALMLLGSLANLASIPDRDDYGMFAFVATLAATAAYGFAMLAACPFILLVLRLLGLWMNRVKLKQ